MSKASIGYRASEKTPLEVLDYRVDFSRKLRGERIEEVIVKNPYAERPGQLAVEQVTCTDDAVTVWVSGGVVGMTYLLSVVIVARGGGRTREERAVIAIPVVASDISQDRTVESL